MMQATRFEIPSPGSIGRVTPTLGVDDTGGIADDRNWCVWSIAPDEGKILSIADVDKYDFSDAEERSLFFYQPMA